MSTALCAEKDFFSLASKFDDSVAVVSSSNSSNSSRNNSSRLYACNVLNKDRQLAIFFSCTKGKSCNISLSVVPAPDQYCQLSFSFER